MALPLVIWKLHPGTRAWRGEWRGFRLTVHLPVVGKMHDGFIDGVRVLRARTAMKARERVEDQAALHWKKKQVRR